MTKAIGIIVAGIALLMAASFVLPTLKTAPTTSLYTSDQYGITFSYPLAYVLEEQEVGTAQRRHYAIALVERQARLITPEASEGPPAIAVDVYQNNLDNLSLEDWIRGTSNSNFKLSPDGRLASVTVGGVRGFYYRWDGLYRGESYAIPHRGDIVVFSVTYLEEGDQIRKDFAEVLMSLSLY